MCPIYDAKIYCVVHKLLNMTTVCIHFGLHNHLVSSGDCHESIEITKELVRHELEKNPWATTLAIALVTSKTFLSHELFVFSETPKMKLQGANFHGLMGRFSTFSSPNIKNLVSSFWHGNSRHSPLDNILELKKNCPYDYIQYNVFPIQRFPKFYLFKMFTKGEGSGIDLLHICN